MSAAPPSANMTTAIARNGSARPPAKATHIPNPTTANPHTQTATMTARPWR